MDQDIFKSIGEKLRQCKTLEELETIKSQLSIVTDTFIKYFDAKYPEFAKQKEEEARKEKEADDRKPYFVKVLEKWKLNIGFTPFSEAKHARYKAYEEVLNMPELKAFLDGWRMECDMRGNTFESELRHILNKYSIDSRTSTPDYILADMIRHMLDFTVDGKVRAGAFVPLSKQWPGMEKHETPPRVTGMLQELAAGYGAPAEPV